MIFPDILEEVVIRSLLLRSGAERTHNKHIMCLPPGHSFAIAFGQWPKLVERPMLVPRAPGAGASDVASVHILSCN